MASPQWNRSFQSACPGYCLINCYLFSRLSLCLWNSERHQSQFLTRTSVEDLRALGAREVASEICGAQLPRCTMWQMGSLAGQHTGCPWMETKPYSSLLVGRPSPAVLCEEWRLNYFYPKHGLPLKLLTFSPPAASIRAFGFSFQLLLQVSPNFLCPGMH